MIFNKIFGLKNFYRLKINKLRLWVLLGRTFCADLGNILFLFIAFGQLQAPQSSKSKFKYWGSPRHYFNYLFFFIFCILAGQLSWVCFFPFSCKP
ncbi:MAG: hypothetical protein JWR38_4743 [Mucilaginibacter sp.]|nr:hypothetical protein [Mucilaginibacter sp.]